MRIWLWLGRPSLQPMPGMIDEEEWILNFLKNASVVQALDELYATSILFEKRQKEKEKKIANGTSTAETHRCLFKESTAVIPDYGGGDETRKGVDAIEAA
ncbi:hypothetical protein DH2020_003889 [Rehmannia glutinosa]|uniref:Uncharacterized protein n=1 Tax=Rehmannia glutinosa TaxID=99300 RepID=A0ABR0XN10_REHGL